jgi:hypothetical protein
MGPYDALGRRFNGASEDLSGFVFPGARQCVSSGKPARRLEQDGSPMGETPSPHRGCLMWLDRLVRLHDDESL